MSERRDLDLLVELARLVRKYGPEAFESLASSVASPEFSESLATLLTGTARVARATPRKTRGAETPGATTPIRTLLDSLSRNDPEKYEVVKRFHDDLVSGSILPRMRDIRAFVLQQDLPELRTTSRQKAINPLVRSLISFPVGEISRKTQGLRRSEQQESGLQSWSDLILGKKRGQPH